MTTVGWTEMKHGTKADYQMLTPRFEDHARGSLVGNLTTMLGMLKGDRLGYKIDRFDHSLQSATRAYRNNERIDLVVGALLHDVADAFAPENHSEAAAALLAPYVDSETHWIIKHHGIFQGYYYFHHLGGDRHARELYHESQYFDACVDFCENYDQNSFDPSYQNMTIEDFMPMLEEVFSRSSMVPGVVPIS